MEIKCKQCSHPNPMGVIFCRECGAKLEIENIDPKTLKAGLRRRKHKIKLKPAHFTGFFIVLLLAAVLIPAFFLKPAPPELPLPGVTGGARPASLEKYTAAQSGSELRIAPDLAGLLLTAMLQGSAATPEKLPDNPTPRIVVARTGNELRLTLVRPPFQPELPPGTGNFPLPTHGSEGCRCRGRLRKSAKRCSTFAAAPGSS